MSDAMVTYDFDDTHYMDMLLREGHSPYAASYAVRSKKEKLIREFKEKNEILRRELIEIGAYDFLDLVFPGLDTYMVIASGDGTAEEHGTYMEMHADELVDYQGSRNDVFVTPCSFIKGYYSKATCRNIYAFIIDVDEVEPSVIERVLKNKTLGHVIPMPTIVVNSGSGVHFYYVLETPVPFFKKNRASLGNIYKHLFGIVRKNIAAKADWHSMIQPFRVPGSLTKLKQMATGFVGNDKWNIYSLAKRVGAEFDGDLIQLDIIDQKEYNRQQNKQRTGEKCPKCGNDLVFRKNDFGKEFIGCMGYPNCGYMTTLEGEVIKKRKSRTRKKINRGFYEYCLDNVWKKTTQGRRYLAMVGLVIVAYKTGIEKAVVEEDLNKLVEHYNEIGATFRMREVKKALRAYNQKAILTSAETLEDYFGWEFKRKGEWKKGERDAFYQKEQERIYKFTNERRKQLVDAGAIDEDGVIISRRKYALFQAREKRDRNQAEYGTVWDDNRGRKSKEIIVNEWQKQHPNGKKVECIKETGLSKPTVYKWWK